MTQSSILNKALSRAGANVTISSINDDRDEARLLRTFYDNARQELLREHGWQFALTYSRLVYIDDAVDSVRWVLKYKFPNNILRIIELDRRQDESVIPFTRAYDPNTGDAVIYTNRPDAVAVGVADVEEEDYFDPSFEDTLSWRLAFEIAPNLSADPSLVELLNQQYLRALNVAKTKSNSEFSPSPDADAPWIQNR